MQGHWSSISSTPAGHRSDEHSFHRKLYIDSNTHLSNTHLATLPPPPSSISLLYESLQNVHKVCQYITYVYLPLSGGMAYAI